MSSRAAAPKGTMSCRTQGDFRSFIRPSVCADLSLEVGIRALKLGFGPRGWDLGLEAGI